MVTIKLYGDLRRFGAQYDFQVETAQEALSGLFSQLSELKKAILNGRYHVKFGDREITIDDLQTFVVAKADAVVHITPAIEGAGKWGQAIAGAVLVVVGAYFGQAWLVNIGAGIAFGGIANALTKPPRLGDASKSIESSQSSSFSNLDNMVAQGRAVPLAYGDILTGSYVASMGIESLRNNPSEQPTDPSGEVVSLIKVPINGIPATAPNGQRYQSDAKDDSVLAQLYMIRE